MAKDDEKEKIVLQSRQSIYNYEKRVYSFWGYTLPTPISLSEAGYLVVVELVVFILNWTFKLPTLFSNFIVDNVIKFGLIPYLTVRVIKYSKLDGKSPIAFVRDYISFFFDRNKKYEMFRDVTNVPEHEEYILDWWCSSRHRLRVFNKKSRRSRN